MHAERPENATCLWEDGLRQCVVGIIGTGAGFAAITSLIAETALEEFLPPMRLAGVACRPGEALLRGLDQRGIMHHATWQELLAVHPDITLVVDLREERAELPGLRTALPPQVSLIDRQSAVFLCALHNMSRAGAHTLSRLDRSRAMLDAVAAEIREDIMLLDARSRVLDMNDHVCQRTGRPKEHLTGLPCWQVQTLEPGVPFCEAPAPDCPFAAVLRTGRKAEALMTRITPDGELRYFRVYAYPVVHAAPGAGNGSSRVLVMRRDITERTLRERDRGKAEKMAVVGEMSMYLAHEIRNPLCAIGGFINALSRSPNLGPSDREKIAIVLDETRRLEAMLTAVLDFARPGDDHGGEADAARTTAEALELMRIGYASQGFEFRLEADPDLPLAACAPDRLKQCMVNLLKNSMEAMPGGGTITARVLLDGDMVAIQVSDTGRGMTPEELEHVFSPFHSRKHEGYGLGLAMIRKIVEGAGGDVRLLSREGRGTTVVLRLPPVQPRAAGEDGAAASGDGAHAPLAAASPRWK